MLEGLLGLLDRTGVPTSRLERIFGGESDEGRVAALPRPLKAALGMPQVPRARRTAQP